MISSKRSCESLILHLVFLRIAQAKTVSPTAIVRKLLEIHPSIRKSDISCAEASSSLLDMYKAGSTPGNAKTSTEQGAGKKSKQKKMNLDDASHDDEHNAGEESTPRKRKFEHAPYDGGHDARKLKIKPQSTYVAASSINSSWRDLSM